MPLKWAMRTFCNTTLMAQDLTTSQIERQNILNNRILRFAPEIDFASKTTCSILPSKSSGTLGRRKCLIINDGVFPMNCFCVHRERLPPFYGPVGHIAVPDDLLGNSDRAICLRNDRMRTRHLLSRQSLLFHRPVYAFPLLLEEQKQVCTLKTSQ